MQLKSAKPLTVFLDFFFVLLKQLQQPVNEFAYVLAEMYI